MVDNEEKYKLDVGVKELKGSQWQFCLYFFMVEKTLWDSY